MVDGALERCAKASSGSASPAARKSTPNAWRRFPGRAIASSVRRSWNREVWKRARAGSQTRCLRLNRGRPAAFAFLEQDCTWTGRARIHSTKQGSVLDCFPSARFDSSLSRGLPHALPAVPSSCTAFPRSAGEFRVRSRSWLGSAPGLRRLRLPARPRPADREQGRVNAPRRLD